MNASLRAQIDRYFKGTANAAESATMFDALIADEEATRYFERRRVLSDLDPQKPGAQDRIAQSLGLPTSQPATQPASLRTFFAPLLGVAAAAAAVLFLVVPGGEDDGFSPRGGGDQPSFSEEVLVFRVDQHGSELLKGDIAASDELAFAYRNPAGHRGLMVYGVDDAGEIYWYHPAWTDPDDNPAAIDVREGKDLVELKEAVTHDIGGRRLKIYGLFVDAPTTVREVEEALKGGADPAGARLLADVGIQGETR